MDIIKLAITRPVTVLVVVFLVVMFGLLGLWSMPYQLSPSVVRPEISVRTVWPGATPYEIESDVIEEQEKVLKGLAGLDEMESTASNGLAEITLRFKLGTDLDDALLRVSNKLNEVPSYPENVEKPVINATGASSSPVIWLTLKSRDDNPRHIDTYRTYFENYVRQHLERVPGVADLFVFGGTEEEMHVIVKPEKLAAYGLTYADVTRALRLENANVPAGLLGVGRREYRIRTVAEYRNEEDIRGVLLFADGQRRVTIGDVADVVRGYQKPQAAMFHNARPGIACGIRPEPGANILTLTDEMEKVVKRLNEEMLEPQGIYLEWVYDQRPYINGAINLVKQNIAIGGVLALCVLLIFLRSLRASMVVAAAIPISIIGTFIFMKGMGRNLNVVSLAGISFAVGMLVDNSIVVLENIDRHRKMGKSPFLAAYDGAREVWGAVLASTLTTIAVFLPVVFMEDEAGQLFKDIALAVTCAVGMSMLVSIWVIPMMSRYLFKFKAARRHARLIEAIGRPVHSINDAVGRFGTLCVNTLMALVGLAVRNALTRLTAVLMLTGAALATAWALFPPMEYLPTGNRNLVINILIPPPGLSYEERRETGRFIFESTRDYFKPGGGPQGRPGIKNMFYVGADRFMMFGAVSSDEQRAAELIPVFRDVIGRLPGIFGVSLQASIFEQGIGAGRNVNIDISGDDLNAMVAAGNAMMGRLYGLGMQVRPLPALDLLYPEVNIVPDRERLAAVAMTARDFGEAVDILMDGRKVGDFKQEGKKKIDLVAMASESLIETPEDIADEQIAVPGGRVMRVDALARFERSSGLTQIRHLERSRTVTLQVTPPKTTTIQETMGMIEKELLPRLRADGLLNGLSVTLSGAADKLTETRMALQGNFILAALITYLLMSALFGNFIYPFVIMFTVPLACAGGLIGLKLTNLLIAPSPLDILTMLGFVILIGTVVNNAILIVHQSLNNIREGGMHYTQAVLESVRTRLRPIFMSTTTSVFGMLPLVVAPGPGSELYRGLGSVVLGGLAGSTIFTIFVIPALLMFFIRMEKNKDTETEATRPSRTPSLEDDVFAAPGRKV
ncbi:MAG: efflux RND transporter permease subunit [Candidatus Sumerlaeia bacterium]